MESILRKGLPLLESCSWDGMFRSSILRIFGRFIWILRAKWFAFFCWAMPVTIKMNNTESREVLQYLYNPKALTQFQGMEMVFHTQRSIINDVGNSHPTGKRPFWIQNIFQNISSNAGTPQKTPQGFDLFSRKTLPLDPKTMKNEGFKPPIYIWVITPKNEGFGFPW